MPRRIVPSVPLARLLGSCIDPEDDERERAAKVGLLAALIGTSAVLLLWAGFYGYLGERVVALLYLAHALQALVVLVIFVRTRWNYRQFLNLQLALALIIPFLVSLRLGGLAPSGS